MSDNKILGIDKGILGAFLLLLGLVGIIGALYLQQYVYGIVLGSVFQAVSGGGINVTAGTNTFLNNTESSFFTTIGRVNTGAAFAGSLIVVAIVLVVFGGFLLYGRGYVKKWKGDKGGGDMGY